MLCRCLLAARVILAVAIAPLGAYAVQPDDTELKAIRAAAAAYGDSLEEGDAEALAAAWTADGDYVDAAGRAFKARDLIAAEFREGPGNRGRIPRVTMDRVRLVGPEYDKDEIPKLKAQLKDKAKNMSASQLRFFLEDLQQKLAILGSKEALDDRAWAEDRLTHFAAAPAEKFRKTLPDVANMTAAQVKQALDDIRQRRAATVASQKAFDQDEALEVAATREANRQTAESEAEMSYSGGNSYSGNSGGYAPVNYPEQYYAPGYSRYLGGWRW